MTRPREWRERRTDDVRREDANAWFENRRNWFVQVKKRWNTTEQRAEAWWLLSFVLDRRFSSSNWILSSNAIEIEYCCSSSELNSCCYLSLDLVVMSSSSFLSTVDGNQWPNIVVVDQHDNELAPHDPRGICSDRWWYTGSSRRDNNTDENDALFLHTSLKANNTVVLSLQQIRSRCPTRRSDHDRLRIKVYRENLIFLPNMFAGISNGLSDHVFGHDRSMTGTSRLLNLPSSERAGRLTSPKNRCFSSVTIRSTLSNRCQDELKLFTFVLHSNQRAASEIVFLTWRKIGIK